MLAMLFGHNRVDHVDLVGATNIGKIVFIPCAQFIFSIHDWHHFIRSLESASSL